MTPSKQHSPIPVDKKPPKRSVIFFKLFSILTPFLFLCLVEIGLRIFHYGNNLDLFIEYKGDEQYLVLNPAATKRYFTNQAIAPTGNRELFKKVKDKNTLRIFVLGESTTIGYPYFHNGSFSRWLLYRLMQSAPEQQVELINISVTAVNSYTVLGFAKEVLNYEPDAVLIYSGHNEYYGALGVGSTNKIGGSRGIVQMMLALRQLRLTQLLTNAYEKLSGASVGQNKKFEGETLMRRMVGEQQIPYASKLYFRGIDQFRSNMDETLALFNKAHIPVFLSNLVSNQKDLKPFVSAPVDSIRFAGFKSNYELGLKALQSDDKPAAYAYLKEADKIFDAHALCNFYLGQIAYWQTDYKQASAYFSKAKDLDGLRFRAPEALNAVIVQLCNKYPYAHLVDAKTLFEANSGHHIIGDELLLEHVHPNLLGYALISDGFYEALKKEHIISIRKEREMSFQQLLNDMPITIVDSLSGIYKIDKLKKSWPFNEMNTQPSLKKGTEEERLADELVSGKIQWPEAMDSLYNYYLSEKDLPKAATVMKTLMLEHPTMAFYDDKTAAIYGELNDYERAAFYFQRAFEIAPSFEKAKMLFVLFLKLDKPVGAMPYLDYALQHNVSGLNLAPVKHFAEEVIQLEKTYARDSSDIPVMRLIAARYLAMGNKDGASKYTEKILKIDPADKDALLLSAQIKKK